MNVIPRKRWGVLLLLAGLALVALGGRQFLAPPQYRAVAVVKVGGTTPEAIHGEIGILRSEAVLSPVIAELGLEREWGDRYNGGKPLPPEPVRQLVLNRLTVRQVRGASLIEIAVTSQRPDETDRIANAIAGAYRNYRHSQRERLISQMVSETLKPLEEKLNQDIHQISEVQQQLHQLHVEFETVDSGSVTGKVNTYLDLKRQLAVLQRSQMDLQKKIAEERLKQKFPGASVVDVINPATPPQRPVSTARDLGVGLICSGALLSLGGGWLLKKPRPPTPVRSAPVR
jgi:uncharacterized protein involved in exopolysaccharide biosynthesis